MKHLSFSLILFFCASLSFAQHKNFDKKLADSLSADKYGMRPYVIVMLKTGPNKIEDKQKMDDLMRGHLDNIGKLAKEGKLSVAGPFFDKNDRDYRGMFIFNVKTTEEADALVKSDPAVAAGVFSYESFKWYGSAALPMYLRYHDKISQENP
ncbi:YciI family protein [Soonwooa purpurea]